MAKTKLDATAQWREENIIDPLIDVWDELDLSTTDDAFERHWKGDTDEAFNFLWMRADPDVRQSVQEQFYADFSRRELSRFGQVVYRHAFVSARLMDQINNRPHAPPTYELAHCAVMFYAGLHFGREEPDFWALYLPVRDAARSSKTALFALGDADAARSEASEVAAEAWAGMDWLCAHQYLPRWRAQFAASGLQDPGRFPASIIFKARDLPR